MHSWGIHGVGKNLLPVIICLFVFVSAQPSWAGAWLLGKGEGQSIQTTLFDKANRAYDTQGKLSKSVQFSKTESSLYWEHGLTDTITLIMDSSFQNISFIAGVDAVQFQGFGDTNIGVRHVVHRSKKSVISAQASIVLPGPGEIIADADLGIGAVQYEARILAGRSFKFKNKDGFVDVQAAWRARPGEFRNEWRVDAATGWRPKKNIQILAQGFYASSQEAVKKARSNERLKLQTSIVFDKNTKTSYQVGYYQTVAGRAIIKESALFIAVWKRY